MKILITENQLKRLIENILIEQDNNRELELIKKKGPMMDWFYENVVDKVKQITKPEYPDSIFYVDKNTDYRYMEYDKKNKHLFVNYDKIWSYFQSNYSPNDKEIQQLIKGMMGEAYNLWDVTPTLVKMFQMGEHYNLWDVTPFI